MLSSISVKLTEKGTLLFDGVIELRFDTISFTSSHASFGAPLGQLFTLSMRK